MSQPKCPYCGGDEIISDILVGLTAEAGSVGLRYKAAMIFIGIEPFLADLCTGCGSVIRFRVQNTDRKWKTQEP